MAVMMCSARIDENNNAYGGIAGDQNGYEVSMHEWFLHPKGWHVLRPTDAATAEKIACCMERACKNPNIGFDEYQRNTLYEAVQEADFDPGRVSFPVETDCSALIRVCLAFAGIRTPDFNTASLAGVLLDTGLFAELTEEKYTVTDRYLRRGDILVTRTQGHSAVIVSDGPLAQENEPVLMRLRGRRTCT